MITIDKTYEVKQIINKSEFICTLFPIKDGDEATLLLQSIRKKYYDATHNCYAYIWGLDGQNCRFSDDGEPSQTAGAPILDCLKKNELTNVLAVVTRFYGGIKLGAGGLVRAYSSTTALACKVITPLKLTCSCYAYINVSYNNYNKITRYLAPFALKSKDFNDNINLTYLIDYDKKDEFQSKLIELVKGQIEISFSDKVYLFL